MNRILCRVLGAAVLFLLVASALELALPWLIAWYERGRHNGYLPRMRWLESIHVTHNDYL